MTQEICHKYDTGNMPQRFENLVDDFDDNDIE